MYVINRKVLTFQTLTTEKLHKKTALKSQNVIVNIETKDERENITFNYREKKNLIFEHVI